jgi:hypothetical protein
MAVAVITETMMIMTEGTGSRTEASKNASAMRGLFYYICALKSIQ